MNLFLRTGCYDGREGRTACFWGGTYCREEKQTDPRNALGFKTSLQILFKDLHRFNFLQNIFASLSLIELFIWYFVLNVVFVELVTMKQLINT